MGKTSSPASAQTLVQIAKRVRELAGTYEEARQRADEIAALKTRRAELVEVIEALEEVSGACAVMRAETIPATMPAELGGLLETARATRVAYAADPKSIVKPKAFRPGPLNKAIAEARDQLRSSWRSWVVGSASQGEGLERVLEVLEPLRSSASKIRQYRDQLEKRAQTLPSGPGTIEEVRQIKADLQAVMDDLDAKGVDSDILSFLKRVVQGVSLETVLADEKIRAWIESEDLASHFTVRAT